MDHYLSNLFFLISSIPDAVWGAVIASILTLSGVLFTNRENRRSLERQLDHDVEKMKIDRDHDLKKNVFLESASSYSKTLSVIGKLGNIEIPLDDLVKVFDDHGPIAAKMYLIAREETVERALDISNDISQTYLELLRERRVFQNARNTIDLHKKTISKSDIEKDRVLETMKEMNLSGVKDRSKFDYLSTLFEAAERRREDAENEISSLESKHNENYYLFMRQCIHEYSRLSAEISRLIVAVRLELNTSGNGDHFSKIMENAMNEMASNFDDAMKESQALTK